MTIRTAIVDDSAQDRSCLAQMLGRCVPDGVDLVTSFYESGEEFLEAAQTHSFDLAFLDIQMEGIDGLVTAARIREENRRMLIVFLTRIGEHMADGYKVRAFRYLLKPLRQELLEECVYDAAAELLATAGESVSFGSGIQRTLLPARSIYYLRAAGNYIFVYTEDETLRFRRTLRDIAAHLPPEFVQIHRGDIVNVEHIVCLDAAEAQMRDGTRFSVSRTYRRALRERFDMFHSGL